MKNFKTAIFVTALATTSYASADGIETVLPKYESTAAVSLTANQAKFGPVTILDHVRIEQAKARAEVSVDVNVDANSVSVIEDTQSIKDVL